MKDEILTFLPRNHPWADRILWFDTIDSTNTHAKRLAADNAPAGTVLIADCQTAGRGRLGRQFQSPEGQGIYMSVILRPGCPPEQLMHLTCAAAVAMCDALEDAVGIRPGIKWTNDLVFEGRKLAGILTELSVSPKTGLVDWAVIGVGVNCCQRAADFSREIQSFAGSLAMATGCAVSRPEVAAAMISGFFEMEQALFQPWMARYRANCITIGKEISLVRGDLVQHGLALDVDDKGALIVRFSDGSVEAVNSGEISVRGLYGYV